MFRVEAIIALLLVVIDIMFTYMLLYKTKKLGYKEWWKFERNPIVRTFLKKYGLHGGIRMSASFSVLLMTGVIFYLNWRTNWLDFSRLMFFVMGAYTLVVTTHIFSFLDISKEEVKNNKKNSKRCNNGSCEYIWNCGSIVFGMFLGILLVVLNENTVENDNTGQYDSYSFSNAVHYAKSFCEKQGVPFQYFTQGGQIRCETYGNATFYNVTYVFDHELNYK